MNRTLQIVRLHLLDRWSYTWLPWSILAFTFAVNLAAFAIVPRRPEGNYSGAVACVFVFMTIVGIVAATKSLPFAISLGVSRRTYYLGTVTLVVMLSVAMAAILTALWEIESATNGWGLSLHFFRVPWLLNGSWYQAFLTSISLLLVFFCAGMWTGLIFLRFKMIGMLLFIGAFVLVLLAIALAITWAHSWDHVGHFLSSVTVLEATGLFALVALLLAGGGYVTVRKVAF